MQGLIVLETVNIIESALASVERQMKPHAPVETDDKEVEVVTYAHTRADS